MNFKFQTVKTITDPAERRWRLARIFEFFEQQKIATTGFTRQDERPAAAVETITQQTETEKK